MLHTMSSWSERVAAPVTSQPTETIDDPLAVIHFSKKTEGPIHRRFVKLAVKPQDER